LKIDKYIKEKAKLIDDKLKELIPEKDLLQQKLFDAANYSLHSGGKRIRPILVFATVETLDEDPNIALDIACAIELIHTYSLIHDDLPCMDNDDMRRGKKSLHKAFSVSLALLTGDFLLTYAFEVIANAKKIPNDIKIKIISTLTRRIGGHGMIAGQVLDIEMEGKKDIDLDTLDFINKNKTANLLEASLECGAIIAKANEKEMAALKRFGQSIGRAYQIVDDILDFHEKDRKKKKVTNVSKLGMKRAKEKALELYNNGIMHLAALSYPPPLLKDLAYKLVKRDY
jgi:geranylgeranyl diphosphate synthase type II